jgi:hypothetical protein
MSKRETETLRVKVRVSKSETETVRESVWGGDWYMRERVRDTERRREAESERERQTDRQTE